MAITVELATVFGNPITAVTNIEEVTCTVGVNRVGWFSIAFALEDFPKALFFTSNELDIDKRVSIWRKPRGRGRRLIFHGLVRKYEEIGERYTYVEDFSEEYTVVYAAGKGTEDTRASTSVSSDREDASAINRREGLYENVNESDAAILQDGANGVLYDNRPIMDFLPKNIEINYIYPQDWKLGDLVRVSSGKPDTIVISGPCLNDLLLRRIVAYDAGTAEAKKNDYADDMMKAYVDENLDAGAVAGRQLPSGLGFEIADDQSAGPTLEYGAERNNLFDVLCDISDRAAEDGTRVYFGVVPIVRNGIVIPRFVTRIGQWGADRTSTIRVGEGVRRSDLMVAGIEVRVTRDGEVIKPRFEDISND